MVQLSTGTPSSWMVQAPQEDSSHPRLEPVRPRSSLRTSSRSLLGSTASSYRRPLTRSSMSSLFTEEILLRRSAFHHGDTEARRRSLTTKDTKDAKERKR